MLRKFLIAIMAFVTVFMYQSQTWAAVNHADKISEAITIEKNTFLQSDSSPFELARRGDNRGNSNSGSGSILWVASIFIPGLGQILMGDILRGLSFWLYYILATVIMGVFSISIGTSAAGGVLGLLYLIIYIWNIVDAVNMAYKDTDAYLPNSDKLSEKTEKQFVELKEKLGFLEKVNLNKEGITLTAISF